jgi:hypothetical protein
MIPVPVSVAMGPSRAGIGGCELPNLLSGTSNSQGVGEVPEALLIYQQVLMESVDDWPMAKFYSRHWG